MRIESEYLLSGIHNGVFVQLKKVFSSVIDVGGCSLYRIHNAARHAVSKSDEMGVDDLLQEIFFYFKCYVPEQHKFEQVRKTKFYCLFMSFYNHLITS